MRKLQPQTAPSKSTSSAQQGQFPSPVQQQQQHQVQQKQKQKCKQKQQTAVLQPAMQQQLQDTTATAWPLSAYPVLIDKSSLYAFNSFFWPALSGAGKPLGSDGMRYDYDAVRRWTLPARTRTTDVVTGRELLLVPLNHGNAHWCVRAK